MNSSDALNPATAPDKDNDSVGIDDPSYYRLNEEETETIEETNFNSAQLQPAEKSKNINCVLVYVFLIYCSRSLWNQSVIAAYVYLLKSDDPKFVGILTCIMGIAQLLSGFPAGVLADKYRRDTLLKVSSAFGVIAATLTLIATQIDHFILLGVALSCWGLFWGVSSTSLSALFADSISDGERSKYFTKRSICTTIGNSTGPLVGLIVFSYIGNEWSIEECKFVLAGGQFLSIPALIMLCTLNDDYAIADQGDHGHHEQQNEHENHNGSSAELNKEEFQINQETNRTYQSDSSDSFSSPNKNNGNVEDDDNVNVNDNDLEMPLLSLVSKSRSSSPISLHDNFNDNPSLEENQIGNPDTATTTTDTTNTHSTTSKSCCFNHISESRIVPALITMADVLSGLAAGMSIRYFPIFFLENLQLSPRLVQVLFLSSTICMAIMQKITLKVASKFGRLQATLCMKWLGASLMISMIISYLNHAPTYLVCIFWVSRTAIMNSTSAITRSILMDAVPKNERAKWSSLDNLTMFGWSGSAAIGGYLVDYEGIIFNFSLTVCFQLVATIPFLFLFGRVQREQQ
jgi:MFS family permease